MGQYLISHILLHPKLTPWWYFIYADGAQKKSHTSHPTPPPHPLSPHPQTQTPVIKVIMIF